MRFELHTNHSFLFCFPLSLCDESASYPWYSSFSLCAQRTPEESLEMAMNSFSVYPRFSDPCRAHIHLMGLQGGRDQRSLTAGNLRCSTRTSEWSEWREQSDGTLERWVSYSGPQIAMHSHSLTQTQLWCLSYELEIEAPVSMTSDELP